MTSDRFEVLHRFAAEAPRDVQRTAAGLRIALKHAPPVVIHDAQCVVTCRGERIALEEVVGVHIAYETRMFEPQILAQLSLRTRRGRVALFPAPVVVYARGQAHNPPGHLRWIAQQIARVASRASGAEVVVSPARSEQPVPEPRWTELPAALGPELPSDAREDGAALVWVDRSFAGRFAAMGLLVAVLVIAPATLVGLAATLSLASQLGVDADALVLLLWAAAGLVACLGLLPFGWLAIRARTHRADANGIALDRSPTERIAWPAADGLVLTGRVGSAVDLRTRRGHVLHTWRSTRWSTSPRIVDIRAFAERLAALGGVPLDLELPAPEAWREAEQERRDGEARKAWWIDLALPIVFHDQEHAAPVEPPGVQMNPEGWSLPISSASWVRIGRQPISWSRAMTTRVNADATGVGTGRHRRPWSEVDGFHLAWRAWKAGKRADVERLDGRIELHTRGRRVQLGPWVPIRYDGQDLIPPGELVWLRDTLRALHAQYVGHSEGRGTADDVPEALREIASRPRQAETG
ncbi:MAG: hypothetical protein H6737_20150 [Alphaproteobacteria bacterium]|nr:hypothetical protein [Alphaproteobacteria bacterium]